MGGLTKNRDYSQLRGYGFKSPNAVAEVSSEARRIWIQWTADAV